MHGIPKATLSLQFKGTRAGGFQNMCSQPQYHLLLKAARVILFVVLVVYRSRSWSQDVEFYCPYASAY